MARFYGIVGYSKSEETRPGIWEEVIFERPYKGDIYRQNRRLESSGDINMGIVINNEISLIADVYANENFQYIKYVNVNNSKWTVTNAEVRYPRLILTLGGVYNA